MHAHCECGTWTGICCEWTGPIEEMVVVEYMPEWVRASHAAAGNSGTYPVNGAVRVACNKECADMLLESEGDPEEWPDGCTWIEVTDLDLLDYVEPVEHAYWFRGAAFCAECVEGAHPCLGPDELARAVRAAGKGLCAGCHIRFAETE